MDLLFVRQQLSAQPQRQGNSTRAGWNELHCAARDGRVEEVKRILHEVLCGVDDRTLINETALHKAVRGNSAESCKLLLLQGADPNLKNNGGRTPLYFVLSSDVTDVLLKGGADINITDNFEKITPLEFIKESKPELEAVINLLESWEDNQTPLEIKDRGQEKISAYKAAIRHGSKPLQHIRLMLVGPERVGKTSLKKTLLGYDFDISEGKTDGIDSSVTCRVDVENVNNWKEVMNDPGYELSQFIAKETANILKKTSIPKSSSTSSAPLSSTAAADEVVGNKTTERKVNSLADEVGDDEVDGNILPKDVNRLVNTYMKWSDGNLEEKCKLLFSVWDFAGHYLYYTMHQVFLSPRSIYCVVFDVSKNLHAKADLDFFPVGSYQPIVQEFTLNHEMTNLEFLNFWISSIFSHVPANAQGQDGDGLLSPPVFIVGTHLDCITGTDEEKQRKLDKISQTIKNYLEDKAYRDHVVPQIYFVDNKFRQGESLKKFREHVEEVMRKQPYMNKTIPVSWFRFQNHVMKLRKQNNYITLREAKEISTRFGVQNDEILNMLQLFHDVGVVAFYGEHNSNSDAFNDIVVLNPQWLIIVFTKIITINKDEEEWPAYKWCWSKLEEEGILEETLVNHVWSEFPKSQRESLLQIMERFDLLCENKVQRDEGDTHYTEEGQFRRQFFVPCQLKPNKEDIGKVWELELNAVVINIIPKDGFLPEGLFHRLTVRAAAWTQQKEGCQSKPPRLFYRQTELYLDEDHELIMRLHVTHKGNRMIKIIIYYPPLENDESSRSPTPAMCKEVLIFLLNSLKNLKMMWMKRIDFGLHVPCYACKEFDNHHHLLETCLKQVKTACGKKRNCTTFWQNLFGDRQVNQVVKHPLESLAKTNHNQTNKMPVSSPGTSLMSSPGIDNSEITSSTNRLITELTPADAGNEDSGVKINVIGDKNIVIVNNKGIVEINQAQKSTNNSAKTKRAADKLDPNVHKCNECDRVCRSKAGLISHLRSHSVKPRTDFSPDEHSRETGETCSNRSSSRPSRHIKIHSRQGSNVHNNK